MNNTETEAFPKFGPAPLEDVWLRLLDILERNERTWKDSVIGRLDFGGGFGDLVWVRDEEPRFSLAPLFGDDWRFCGNLTTERAVHLANTLSDGLVKRAQQAIELLRAQIELLKDSCQERAGLQDVLDVLEPPAKTTEGETP